MKCAPLTIVVACAWLTAATAGAWWLHKYDSTPGSATLTPEQWPPATRIEASHDRATLLMFAHPQCPCTRTSIEELNRLLAKCQGQVATHVLFFQPSNLPPAWARSSLWASAAAIPGVLPQGDPEGIEARRFGAATSGFVVLYDARGRLLFRGGITAVRGHAGDNPGAEAIVSLVNGKGSPNRQTPVFGCSLLDRCTDREK